MCCEQIAQRDTKQWLRERSIATHPGARLPDREFACDQARRNQRYCLSDDSIGIFWEDLRLMNPSEGSWRKYAVYGQAVVRMDHDGGLIFWYGVGSIMPVELEVHRALRDLGVFSWLCPSEWGQRKSFQTTEVWCKPLIGGRSGA